MVVYFISEWIVINVVILDSLIFPIPIMQKKTDMWLIGLKVGPLITITKNNKTAKIKATWSFPIFRLDKPSFFRGFDEESESPYHSNSKGLICLRPIFRLKNISLPRGQSYIGREYYKGSDILP